MSYYISNSLDVIQTFIFLMRTVLHIFISDYGNNTFIGGKIKNPENFLKIYHPEIATIVFCYIAFPFYFNEYWHIFPFSIFTWMNHVKTYFCNQPSYSAYTWLCMLIASSLNCPMEVPRYKFTETYGHFCC